MHDLFIEPLGVLSLCGRDVDFFCFQESGTTNKSYD